MGEFLSYFSASTTGPPVEPLDDDELSVPDDELLELEEEVLELDEELPELDDEEELELDEELLEELLEPTSGVGAGLAAPPHAATVADSATISSKLESRPIPEVAIAVMNLHQTKIIITEQKVVGFRYWVNLFINARTQVLRSKYCMVVHNKITIDSAHLQTLFSAPPRFFDRFIFRSNKS